MRILHLWQSHYPWDVRVAKINRALKAAGHEVTVLARKRPGEPPEADDGTARILRVGGDRLTLLSVPIPGNPIWIRAIESAIRRVSPRLILVRDIPLASNALHRARRHGIPVVLDMAEHYPEAMRTWKKYADNPLLKTLVHDLKIPDRIEANVVPRMDGIVVVCDEQKDRLVSQYGYPADRICVALNTPEASFREAGQRLADAPTRAFTRFGYHGNLCEDRDLESVLRGFELAADRDPALTLLIAGGGESEARLRAIAATLRHAERVTFTGRYSPEDQLRLYAEVDYGIVSWRQNDYSEHTVANKFFDYAALGKPFIYTDLAPMRRLMPRMHCGVAFTGGSPESLAEAFLTLRAQNREALREHGLAAIAREFNWETDSHRLTEFLGRWQ